jgi:hypothetical protein
MDRKMQWQAYFICMHDHLVVFSCQKLILILIKIDFHQLIHSDKLSLSKCYILDN